MKLNTAILLATAGLAACATAAPAWVNPDLPQGRASADLAACRRLADRDMGQDLFQQPDERSSDPMKLVDRSRSQQRFESLVADCMEDKGYHPAK